MSIEIEKPVLEKACREMIETILLCLPNALKGTIYRIGKPPELIAERIASGIIDEERKKISWGLPVKSGYNTPGKPWAEYRDEPSRPLEAMSWCVEKQKSWTAEDPIRDARSVRMQVEGIHEDFHHMEPVLVRKLDLNLNMYSSEYPKDYHGNVIWKGSEYVTVAVVKIHFRPHSIKIGSYETMVIKKLSRSLGTELLSYQLRQDSLKTMQEYAKDRLNACNILADSLRNTITKSGMIFSLVKQEIGYLRDQWEQLLLQNSKEKYAKVEAIKDLNDMLMSMGNGYEDLRKDLVDVQSQFLELSLPPEMGENWVVMQIEERWKDLLYKHPQNKKVERKIWGIIEKLKESLHIGRNPQVLSTYDKVPEELKWDWVNLIYTNNDYFDPKVLEKLINMLSNPTLDIPSRERSKKNLTQLKALAETMHELEKNTDFLLNQVLNGGDKELVSEIINNAPSNFDPKKSLL
ncbi:MAG: hypothetical protein PVJ69_02870 [Desulfobacteraceae bacterium]